MADEEDISWRELGRRSRESSIGYGLFCAMFLATILALSLTPLNPDGSAKKEYLTLVFGVAAALTTITLLNKPSYAPLRNACWWMAGISWLMLFVMIGVLAAKAFGWTSSALSNLIFT